ncbi:MAG: putative heavy metal-binding protein, partial [Bifidobacterium longum]
MVNERQTDTCADVMYRRERQRGCGEAGLDFVPFIPSQDEVDQQMSALDDKLVAKAQEQYANREIYPLDECYQLDGSTFISAEAFEEILGDEQTHYMAWKNGCIDKLSIDYWEMPDVMAYLVERSIAEGDGGECCYTDAQPIDYAEDCAYWPSEMLECLGANWQEQGVADDGLSYALYGHPNINVENVSGSMMVVSTEQPGLSVMVDYRSGMWVVQPFVHDESFGSSIQFGEWLVPVEASPLHPNVYQHFLEAKHAFDYAIAWIENVGEGALDYCGSQEKRSVSEVRFGSDPTLGSDSSTQTSQRSLAMILVTTTPSVDGY